VAHFIANSIPALGFKRGFLPHLSRSLHYSWLNLDASNDISETRFFVCGWPTGYYAFYVSMKSKAWFSAVEELAQKVGAPFQHYRLWFGAFIGVALESFKSEQCLICSSWLRLVRSSRTVPMLAKLTSVDGYMVCNETGKRGTGCQK
jgi:hypothetical protein